MIKKVTISGIIAVVILLWVLSAFPNETTTDTKSAVKNEVESYKTDKVLDVTQQVIDQTGKQSIDIACKDGNTQACNTTTNSLGIVSIAFGILFIGLFATGAIGFVKWLIGIIT